MRLSFLTNYSDYSLYDLRYLHTVNVERFWCGPIFKIFQNLKDKKLTVTLRKATFPSNFKTIFSSFHSTADLSTDVVDGNSLTCCFLILQLNLMAVLVVFLALFIIFR